MSRRMTLDGSLVPPLKYGVRKTSKQRNKRKVWKDVKQKTIYVFSCKRASKKRRSIKCCGAFSLYTSARRRTLHKNREVVTSRQKGLSEFYPRNISNRRSE